MCKKSNVLFLFVLIFSVFILFSAILPVSDFDNDGYLDSLVTEGFVLLTKFGPVIGLLSLLIGLPETCPAVLQTFSSLFLLPPIQVK